MMLCELQCNALWCICSVCRGKGSITQKVHELETRILLMDHQQQISKLLMDEKERLIEQLQRELSEVKSERDNLKQTLEKQRVEHLQWTESKTVSAAAEVELPKPKLESQTQQPPQFEGLMSKVVVTRTLVPQVLSIHLPSENYKDVLTNSQARAMKMTLKFG